MSFLRKGQFFRIKGERHRVDRIIGGSEFVVTNERTQEFGVYTMVQLMRIYEAGQLDFPTDPD